MLYRTTRLYLRTIIRIANFCLVLWVLFNNGDCYRYTQADSYSYFKGNYQINSLICNATVAEVPASKVKKIYWHHRPPEYNKYIVYKNSKLMCQYPASWNYDIYINSHGVRVIKKVDSFN